MEVPKIVVSIKLIQGFATGDTICTELESILLEEIPHVAELVCAVYKAQR